MNKATKVIKVMGELLDIAGGGDQTNGTSSTNLADFSSGTNVKFKAGQGERSGMIGVVVNVHADNNTVDLKMGNATAVGVELSALEIIPNGGAGIGAPRTVAPSVPAADAQTA